MRRHWLRQALCGLAGHDRVMHFEAQRVALRCVSCGHETAGFALNAPPPTVTAAGDPHRHSLNRPRLVTSRRIA